VCPRKAGEGFGFSQSFAGEGFGISSARWTISPASHRTGGAGLI